MIINLEIWKFGLVSPQEGSYLIVAEYLHEFHKLDSVDINPCPAE